MQEFLEFETPLILKGCLINISTLSVKGYRFRCIPENGNQGRNGLSIILLFMAWTNINSKVTWKKNWSEMSQALGWAKAYHYYIKTPAQTFL